MIQQSFIGKYFVIDTYKYKVYSFPILLFLVNIIYRDKHLMPSMYDHDKYINVSEGQMLYCGPDCPVPHTPGSQ